MPTIGDTYLMRMAYLMGDTLGGSDVTPFVCHGDDRTSSSEEQSYGHSDDDDEWSEDSYPRILYESAQARGEKRKAKEAREEIAAGWKIEAMVYKTKKMSEEDG